MTTIVVGNGGSLLDREMGRVVDTYDRVVRMNHCRINGYEKHVGERTDLWSVSLHWAIGGNWRIWANTQPQPRTILCCPLCTIDEIPERWADKIQPGVEIMPRDKAVELDEFVGGYYVSTGLATVWLFKPCDVIGFDHFSCPQDHYCDDNPNPGSHSGPKERGFFDEMVRQGWIRRL